MDEATVALALWRGRVTGEKDECDEKMVSA